MKKAPMMFLAAMLLGIGMQAQTVYCPYHEGFENGLQSWVAIDGDGDGDTWRVVNYAEVPEFMQEYGYYAQEGNRTLWSTSDADMSDMGGARTPSNWLISPILQLPGDAAIDFSWYVKNLRTSNPGDRYEIRLDFNPDDDIDTSTFTYVLFDSTISNTEYEYHSVSLADYLGLSVRIAIHHYNSQGMGTIQMDNFRFTNNDFPLVSLSGPVSAYANDTLHFSAAQIGGNQEDIAYAWEVDGADYVSSYDEQTIDVVWEQAGTYRIEVALQNSYGTDTAWMDVTVIDCAPVTQYPFVAPFEGAGTRCWSAIDGDGLGQSWGFINGQAYSSSSSMFGYYAQQDNWLVMQPLVLDPDSGYVLMWTVQAAEIGLSPEEHYTVLVSTNVSNPADTASYTALFSETLNSADEVSHHITFDGTLGDTVLIAFRHHDNTDYAEGLYLSNVKVATSTLPIISLRAPDEWIVGDTLCFELDTLSFSPIYDIYWHVQMDTFGSVYDEATMEQFCYVWEEGTDEGYYWVMVEVTNDYGTTIDSARIYLRNCETIEEMPYHHIFGNDEACWRMDGWTTGEATVLLGNEESIAYSFSVDNAGNHIPTDHTLATPYLQLPYDEPYELAYLVAPGAESGDYYSVFVRSDNGVDTLFAEHVMQAVKRRLSLGDYMGQRVQIGFRHQSSPSGFALLLANVSVQEMMPPEVSIRAPRTARKGDDVAISAVVTSSEQLGYEWSFEGAMPSSSYDSATTTVWHIAGEHTIILEVQSPIFGSFYDTTTIEIIDCDEGLQAPFTETFDVNSPCWASIDNDGDGYGWQLLAATADGEEMEMLSSMAYGNSGDCMVSWSTIPTSGIVAYLFLGVGIPANTDNLLASPTIVLGDEEHYTLQFMAASFGDMFGFPAENHESFEVLLGNSEASTAEHFTTTLMPLTVANSTGYRQYSVDLSDYRNQRIRIAIRHRTQGFTGLLVDQVQVTNTLGISDVEASQVKIYPNPATDRLTVEADGLQKVEIIDLQGRVAMVSHTGMSVDISGLSSGVYMVRTTTNQGCDIQKVVKR